MGNEEANSFDQWIFKSYNVSSEGLALYRICASLFILFFLIPGNGWTHYRYLSSLPSDFYAPPPGPMMLLDGFPPFVVFQIVYILIVISVLALLVGYRTKFFSILSGILIFVLQGFVYSIGKANHEALVPLVPIIMALSNWGNSFSVDSLLSSDKQEKVQSWPLVLLSLFIGFMMFTAGLPKILGGWLDPSTHAVKSHLFNQFFVNERGAFLAGYAVQFENQVFWEFLDWATIIFEVGFLISVRNTKWFRFFVLTAVFFHFATQMLLNISFLPNFLAYTAFLSWDRIYNFNKSFFQKRTAATEEQAKRMAVAGLIFIVFFLFSLLKWISIQNVFLVDSDLMAHESIFLFLALFAVIFIIVNHFLKQRKYLSS